MFPFLTLVLSRPPFYPFDRPLFCGRLLFSDRPSLSFFNLRLVLRKRRGDVQGSSITFFLLLFLFSSFRFQHFILSPPPFFFSFKASRRRFNGRGLCSRPRASGFSSRLSRIKNSSKQGAKDTRRSSTPSLAGFLIKVSTGFPAYTDDRGDREWMVWLQSWGFKRLGDREEYVSLV